MAFPIEMLLAFFMTAIGSLGALCFKALTKGNKKLTVKSLLFNKMLYIGGGLYVLTSVFNVVLLKFIDYSIVYPLSAMTYIWTLFISRFVLYEKISIFKIAAVFLIISGVAVINL